MKQPRIKPESLTISTATGRQEPKPVTARTVPGRVIEFPKRPLKAERRAA